MTNLYKVKMRMGRDTCDTFTMTAAESAEDAILATQMKWTGIVVEVKDVVRADDGNGYGYCDTHKDWPLEDHCSDCNAVYCEMCEYE